LRDSDHIGRWGGEEFILILDNTSTTSAGEMVERIRQQLKSSPCRFNQHEYHISMTFGLCTFDGNEAVDACLQRADQAPYQGKQNGKDCVVVCS